jgi:hypothetical protein
MSGLKEIRLYGTTSNPGQTLTVDAVKAVCGRLYAVQYIAGTLAATTDVTISTQDHEAAKTLLTLTDQSADALYYPRDLVHSEAGVALTGTSGGDRTLPLMVGRPRMAIAQGGAAKVGGVILFYIEEDD